MSKRRVLVFVLVFLLVFQASLPGAFLKVYGDESEENHEAAENITGEEEREKIKTVVNSNVTLYENTVYEDLYIQGGSLNLNGYEVEVLGDIVHSAGALNVNGGKLFVRGDYLVQRERENSNGEIVYERGTGSFNMTNDDDYICVDGNLIINSSSNNRLTNGTLEIKGDFIQKGNESNFNPSGNHWVILSGSSLQTVSFNPVTANFSMLELRNYSIDGIFFDKPVRASLLKDNGCVVKFANGGRIGWTLYSDQVIEGDLYLNGGVLDLNGHSLEVRGNVVQAAGTIYIKGGSLYVDGDYRLQTENTDQQDNINYTRSIGYFKMVNDEDYVSVEGDFITQSREDHRGYLTNGVLDLKGNFLQKTDGTNYNFSATENHKLILSGENFQTVTFESSSSSYSCINSLEIINTSEEGVEFSSKVLVTGELIDTTTPLKNSQNIHIVSGTKIKDNVWSHDLSIDGSQTLDKDLTIGGNLYVYSGTQNLKGHKLQIRKNLFQLGGTIYTTDGELLVEGNYIQSGGHIQLSKGKLLVRGDYRIQSQNADLTYGNSNGYLTMNNAEDYVLVEGNFVTQAYNTHEGRLTAGILEVKGDFLQKRHTSSSTSTYNFYATGQHKTILSGDSQQNVSFESASSKFNILEIKNYSDEGVVFLTPLNASTLIDNGCNITFPSNEVLGWTLTGDQVIEGDLFLGGGYLDLNGYNLTVKGDLIQTGGTIDVKNGKLIVEENLTQSVGTLDVRSGEILVQGDYRIQTLLENGEYTNSTGYLKMTEEGGYVKVNGNFVTESIHSHEGFLTNGIIEVQGNLIQKNAGNNKNFMTKENHKILLSGEMPQAVSFDNPANGQSVISRLEISNTSEEGVEFLTKVTVTGEINETGGVVKEAKNVHILASSNFIFGNWSHDINIEGNWTLKEDISIGKNLYIKNGTFNLNKNKVSVGENLILSGGVLNINGGEISVENDFRVQTEKEGSDGEITYESSYGYIYMTKKEDYVLVGGDFTIQSYYDGNTRFTAGVLEVKGDFVQKNFRTGEAIRNFCGSEEHKTILSGESLQRVTFESNTSKFGILEIKNYSEDGVSFTSYLEVDSVIDNGCIMDFVLPDVFIWKISNNETYEGDLNLAGGMLDLNGYDLVVTGDFIQSGGCINVNGGELIVEGDAKISKIYWTKDQSNEDNGEVIKNIQVGKDLYIENSTFDLEGYELKVGGNILQSKGAINGGKVDVTNDFNISGGTINNSEVETGNNLSLSSGTIENSRIKANYLNVSGGNINGGGIEVANNLKFSSGYMRLNGGQFKVERNLIHYGGYLYISGGELWVGGDYRLQSENVDSEGNIVYGDSISYLYMQNSKDRIFVGGNFVTQTRYSHRSTLTNGVLEVKGNFVQKRSSYSTSSPENFLATGNHMVILSGDGIQTVVFESEESGFNILEIRNYSDEGVEFAQPLNANVFIDNGCVVKIPDSQEFYWKLLENEVYEGNLYIPDGMLDLNGYTLTVKGDLIQSGGVVDINGGTLIVEGNYRIETENIQENGQKVYSYSDGTLKMDDPEDFVMVKGDFAIYSSYDHRGSLTEGILEVKGNFTQRTQNSYNFYSERNHKVVLSGDSLQKVQFANTSSKINILEIKNTSNEGVEFISEVIVDGKIINTSTPIINGENLCLKGSSFTDLVTWGYDLSINGNHTLNRDVIVEGNLYIKGGTLNLNGYSLNVGEDLIHSSGTLNVNGGQLFVEKNYRIQSKNISSNGVVTYTGSYAYLQMRNENDYVLVGGRFVIQSAHNHGAYLTAGTLEIKGDFNQFNHPSYSTSAYNYNATGSHRTILNGTEHQRVMFTNPETSSFNELVITKSLEEGYTFNATPVWKSLKEEPADNEPPTAPQNLIVEENTVTDVILKWDASSDNEKVEGYYIYRDGNRIGTSKTTQFVDQWLTPNTEYTYAVRAFDMARNLSEPSNTVTVKTTMDNQPPSVPENLKISFKTGSSLTLTWQPSVDNVRVVGYEIYRDGEYIYTSDTTSFTDRNLVEGRTYTYKVRAIDPSDNKSGYSTEVSGIPVKPKIITTDPKDEVTLGGAAEKRMYVYFADIGYITGYSAVFEYSKDGTQWKEFDGLVYGPYKKGSDLHFYCNWDLDPLDSGNYMVRYRVYDTENNYDEKIVTYIIDRTPPGKVKNLSAVSSSKGIILTWSAAVESDVSHYNIYRVEDGEENLSLLGKVSGRETVSYRDIDVQPNETYRYAIKAVDKFGQEGEVSDYVEVVMEEDVTPPQILTMSPANKATIGKSVKVTVRAEDNMAVSSITLEYYDQLKEEWVEIDTVNTSGVANFLWEDIPVSGEIKVRAVAKDSSGNTSDGAPVRTYYVKDSGPEKVTGLNATCYTTSIILRWNDVSDDYFSYFAVEKKDSSDGSYERYGTVSDKLGMVVSDLDPETTYYFRVAAYDIYGNRGEYSDPVEAVTTKDTEAPAIKSLSPKAGYYKEKIALRGSAVDNVGVSAFVFQISEDRENWTDIKSIEIDPALKTANVSYDFDISGYSDGAYYIRGIAYDKAGNVSAGKFFVEYRIDTTPPMSPSGVKGESTEGEITILWDRSDDKTIKYYNVYRSEEKEGTYTLIKGELASLGYVDRNVEMDKTYYYKISAIDVTGNESEKSDAVEGSLKADVIQPEIISISPENNADLPKNPTIRVLAADNYKLAKVTLEYNTGDDWVLIGSKNLDVYSQVVSFDWDTSRLSDGTYDLRVKAMDKSGNESDYYEVTYNLHVDPPGLPKLTVAPGDWKIDLSWTVENKDDLAGFYVYRSMGTNGSYKKIAGIPVSDTDIYTYEDIMLMPGQIYYYVVEAVDIYGNTERSNEVFALPLDNDSYPPIAYAGGHRVAAVGMEVLFDGRDSNDNDGIERYIWDFGDGTIGTGATPSHVYTEEGVYQVTLTVFDPAGNSSMDTIQVDVRPNREVGVLEVKVIDGSTGKPISGASVYVDFENDTPARFNANSNGIVHIVGKAGSCSVAAYAEGYLPKEVSAQLNTYESSPVTIAIEKGELVVGELKVRRMELDEILEAGIDVRAPENQFVYEFEVTLEFEKTPLPVINLVTNGNGQVLSGGGMVRISRSESSQYAPGSVSTAKRNDEVVVIIDTVPTNRPNVPPTVTCLVIPGEARWLKEFFEVSLTLTNMADPQFVIEDAKAELNLPKGLTLAPTKKEQSLAVSIGSIAGGETKEVQWIIRGDEKGSYDLEAYFSGSLMPFNDAVNATFKTQEPLVVLAGDAMRLNIMPQESAYIGEENCVFFQLTNTSDFPVYNLYFEVGGQPADVPTVHKITQEQIESDEIHDIKSGDVIEIPVLMPGKSVWFDYVTIIDFEGDLSKYYYVLTNATVDQKGTVIPTEVKPIPSHINKYRVITNSGEWVVTEKEDIKIIMEKINHPGATVITTHDDLERIKTDGVNFLPLYYGVITTAEAEGNFEIEINYDITGYQKYIDGLRLYQIKDGQVKDITESVARVDENNPNILTFKGTADDLCFFAIGYEYEEQKKEKFLEVSTVGDGMVILNDSGVGLPVNYKDAFEYGQHIQLVAKENAGSRFAYWENIKTQSIISTDSVYEFDLVSDVNVKAVFYKIPTEQINEFTVVFMNKTGRILKSTKVEKNKSAVPPANPSISGYGFVGWDKDYSNVVEDMIISPVFRRLPDKYSITVEGGTLSDGKIQGEYQFDMPVTVIANEEEEGMKFSHWEQDGVKISSSREFTLYMPKKDTKLLAVFVEDSEYVDTAPFITLSEDVIVDKDAKNIIFVATRNITEDYELVESGIILLKSYTKIEEKEITLDTENIIVGKIKNNSTAQFYVRKLNVEEMDIWYARAYMIYKDSRGDFVTVYSKNIVETTLKDK